MSFRDRLAALERWQKVALGLALATAVYAAFGFLALPPLVRNQTLAVFHDTFGREARIGEVRINPFLLTVDVERFELPDRDGSDFVSFDALHLDFELSTVVNFAYTFGEISLERPFVHVKVLESGDLNFGDMIETMLEEEAEEEVEPAGLPPVLVHLMGIAEGRIVFTDYSRPTDFEHEVAPLDVELRDFGTRPDDESPYSFTATTGAGEALEWEGALSVVPLYSKGRFALTGVRPRTGWLYVQDDVLFEVVDGAVDVEGRYDLDAREGLRFVLDEGEIRVRDVVVEDRASGEPALAIGALDVQGIEVAYPEQTLHVASVSTRAGRHHMLRLEDGSFRAEQLFGGSNGQGEQAGAATAADSDPSAAGDEAATSQADPSAPWQFRIDRVAIEDHHVDFEDRSTTPPARVALSPIKFELEDITQDLTRSLPMRLELGFPGDGRVRVEGPVRIDTPRAELDVRVTDFDLRPYEPYWLPSLDVDLTSGRLSAEGQLRVDAAGDAPEIAYAGGVRLDDLRTVDRTMRADLLAWSALELRGIELQTAPMEVGLERVVLRDPRASLVVAQNGATNLSTVVVGSGADEGAAPAGQGDTAPMPVRIGAVEIVNGGAEVEDRSVRPTFKTGISALGGTVTGLSSERSSPAKVDFTGRLDDVTPVRIGGVVSPLAERTYLDLKLAFENLSMTPLSPYTGKHIGQAIARGKLYLDVEYIVDGSSLVGENTVFLDQFTLGDRVDSPDAVKLPVGLAIALLKDRNGEIHIDLPVRGELDDPEFSVAGLIFGALGNLITKVALSPFAMLGGLAGGDGEEMKRVAFTPGESALDSAEGAKLDQLAGALVERPTLVLEVTGHAAHGEDRLALQRRAFERALRRARFDELQKRWFGDKPETVDEVLLEDEDRWRLIERRYATTFGEEPREMLVPAVAEDQGSPLAQADAETQRRVWRAEVERRLVEATELPSDALEDLARARADAVRTHVVDVGGISAERVFVLGVEVVDVSDATLALTVH